MLYRHLLFWLLYTSSSLNNLFKWVAESVCGIDVVVHLGLHRRDCGLKLAGVPEDVARRLASDLLITLQLLNLRLQPLNRRQILLIIYLRNWLKSHVLEAVLLNFLLHVLQP